MVTRLVDYYDRADREGWALAGAEVPMRAEVGRAVLAGRVDRLERDPDGRLRVLDYKTGSTTPSQKTIDDHLQLAVYQLAVEQGGFPGHGTDSAGAAILRLGRNAPADNPPIVQRPLDEHDDPGWVEEVVHRVAEGMAGAEVLATAGPHCQFCPVRTSCPAQPEGRVLS